MAASKAQSEILKKKTSILLQKQEKVETADFHENWIYNIEDAIQNGKELLILSPPRHGKTELLIHFAIYQIMKPQHKNYVGWR